jgi:perosamine synthetase
MSTTFDRILQFIREYYDKKEEFISLHEPKFIGNERKYVVDAIDSTFVSSVGRYVDKFESMMCHYTGASHAVATVNGTAALHISLLLAGVNRNDLVITQPLSFIATCNAISYLGAEPLFIDVDKDTLGLSPDKLEHFLKWECEKLEHKSVHKKTGKRISACVPMHTFGHPVQLDRIIEICKEYSIPLIEDAAESIGSMYNNKHTGTFGLMGAFSFNGNKTITCGGGGIIITNDESLAKMAKHLTTQAKVPHAWEFVHDQIGYNYRLPNLNAAFACAQMEVLDNFIAAKRDLANQYQKLFTEIDIKFVIEPKHSRSNFWLNAVLFENQQERDSFLKYSNERKIMTRPAWTLMPDLKMFQNCILSDISNARYISERLVNIPSSVK